MIPIALNQEQTFSMDIYGYDEEDNALDLDGGALVYEDQRFEGEINIDDTTGKKFLSFTGVRYGKDYTLELDDTTYEIISGGVTNLQILQRIILVNLYILEKNKDVDDFLLVFNIVYEYGKEKEKMEEKSLKIREKGITLNCVSNYDCTKLLPQWSKVRVCNVNK